MSSHFESKLREDGCSRFYDCASNFTVMVALLFILSSQLIHKYTISINPYDHFFN